jgi:uncharacterized membrane protein YqjE
MNPADTREIPPSPENPGPPQSGASHFPSNWREAILTLVASRVTLIQLESKDAAADALRRLIRITAVVICVFFTWSLLLAGGIAAIAHATGWPWYWIAMGAAAAHLQATFIFAQSARTPGRPPFPVTRSEFKKDREWLETFLKTRKSND